VKLLKRSPRDYREVVSVMSEENRNLWRAMIEWLEIELQTQERKAAIRSELAVIAANEKLKRNTLDVQLY